MSDPQWSAPPPEQPGPRRSRPSAFYSERPVWQLLVIIALLIGLAVLVQRYNG